MDKWWQKAIVGYVAYQIIRGLIYNEQMHASTAKRLATDERVLETLVNELRRKKVLKNSAYKSILSVAENPHYVIFLSEKK